MEVLEVNSVLSCWFIYAIVIGKSAITLYNSFGQNSEGLC